jgi:short-subunit dehydrogenase
MSHEGNGRTALITGASAGIGEALAWVFAAHGFNLVLTARRAERLAALRDRLKESHGIEARALPADLAKPESCAGLVATLEREGVVVDALVNNAGYGVNALYRDSPWETQRDFIQVLITAPAEMTSRLLPGMTRRGYGRILNVASVAGFLPGSAGHTLYGASKAALIKFSEALHAEQAGTGVYVTALCPGFTYSEFHDVNATRAAVNRLPKFLWLDTMRVAKEGYEAVMQNRAVAIPGGQYKTIVTLARLLPLGLANRAGRAGLRRAGKKT